MGIRDIVVGSFCLILSLIGFFANYRYRAKISKQVTLVVVAIILVLASKLILEFRQLFVLFEIASFIAGYILAFIPYYSFANVFSFFLVGVFTLSSHSNQWTMIVSLALLTYIGYLSSSISPTLNTTKLILFLVPGLVLYYTLSLIFVPSLWLNGILAGIFCVILGVLINRNRKLFFASPLWLSGLVYFSFILYPDFTIRIKATSLIAHQLTGFNFKSDNSNTNPTNQKDRIVLIETWNQFCSKCFESMADLHPFLSNEELKYPGFKHYYAFVGSDMVDDSIYKFNLLPYKDQIVIIDPDMDYYKTLEMQGAPYFNFYKDGTYILSVSGYNSKYIKRYEKFIDKEISKLLK